MKNIFSSCFFFVAMLHMGFLFLVKVKYVTNMWKFCFDCFIFCCCELLAVMVQLCNGVRFNIMIYRFFHAAACKQAWPQCDSGYCWRITASWERKSKYDKVQSVSIKLIFLFLVGGVTWAYLFGSILQGPGYESACSPSGTPTLNNRNRPIRQQARAHESVRMLQEAHSGCMWQHGNNQQGVLIGYI